jgi:hypothetical protein
VSVVNPSNKQRRKFFINYLTVKEAKKLHHGEVHTIAFINGVEGSVTEISLVLGEAQRILQGTWRCMFFEYVSYHYSDCPWRQDLQQIVASGESYWQRNC